MRKTNLCLAALVISMAGASLLRAEPAPQYGALASLKSLNEKAEHAYESVYGGKSGKVLKDILAMHRYIGRLEGELNEGTIDTMRDTVSALEKALSAGDQHAALLASNQLTMLAAEASRDYHPSMPVEVTLLDYDGRQIQLWAKAGDLHELKRAAGQLEQSWNALLPDLQKHHADAVIKHFDTLVERANRSTSVADYADIANPVLDAVDEVEKVYGE